MERFFKLGANLKTSIFFFGIRLTNVGLLAPKQLLWPKTLILAYFIDLLYGYFVT